LGSDVSSVPRINATGQVAFRAQLSGTGVGFGNDNALFAGAPGALVPVARAGDPAPGTPPGVRYAYVYDPALNDHGDVAYLATLELNNPGNSGIFAGPAAAPQLVARTGDTAPQAGPGVRFATMFGSFDPGLTLPVVSPVFNNAGQLAFPCSLSGVGVTADNDDALYAGPAGGLRLVARAGEQAPGLPPGVKFGSFNYSLAINDSGQVAFVTKLAWPTPSADEVAIYVFDPAVGIELVARSGQMFDVGGGDLRRIGFNTLGIVGGQDAISRVSLSDDGRLLFLARFDGGTQGLFLANVPEPTALAAAFGLGVIGAFRPRRRKA
jgi:hypothetical protein